MRYFINKKYLLTLSGFLQRLIGIFGNGQNQYEVLLLSFWVPFGFYFILFNLIYTRKVINLLTKINLVHLYLRANTIYKAFEKSTRGEITDVTGVKFGIFH